VIGQRLYEYAGWDLPNGVNATRAGISLLDISQGQCRQLQASVLRDILLRAPRCAVLNGRTGAALFDAAVTAMSAQGQTCRKAGTQSLRSRTIRDSGVADEPWTTKAVVKRPWLHEFLACSGGSQLRLPTAT
jgi:hypothetical protein